jgi:hypothetical protein
MTQQGMPALHFDDGDFSAATSHSSVQTDANSSGMLAHTGPHMALPLTTTIPPGAAPTATLPPGAVVASSGTTGVHKTIPLEPAADNPSETAIGEPEEETRSNPYRALSLLLLLLVVGLGGAIWYLLQRMGPGAAADALESADHVDHDPAATPPTLPDQLHPQDPTVAPPDPDTKDPGKETPTKPVKKDPGKKTPPSGPLVEASDADTKAFVDSLIADVTRCASSNDVPRQRVTIFIETEASTGRVKAHVENPRSSAAFVSCAEKSVERKKFKKGRKEKNFRAHLDI